MARLGIVRAAWQGPRAFGTLITRHSSLPEVKKIAAMRFLESYESLQYGTVDDRQRTTALIRLNTLLAACR